MEKLREKSEIVWLPLNGGFVIKPRERLFRETDFEFDWLAGGGTGEFRQPDGLIVLFEGR